MPFTRPSASSRLINPVNQLKMTFPAGLLPPEAKPSTESWQEYENPQVSRVGIDVFRVSGRESSTNSFASGYQSYNALTLTYVHNSGSEIVAEGAGNRWGSRYYFHNMTFEYQGGQRGIYLRFDMKPPENFVPPPEILPAARLEKIKKQIAKLYTGGIAGAPPPGETEVAWALIARAVFNIVASDFYYQNGWRELTTKYCVFGSGKRARRGGVRIVFATTRAVANKDGDMTTMFGNSASDKITFGCVQVNPRISSTRDATYRGAWRGGARAANSRIKLLSDPIDRSSENYVRIVDSAAAEDATHALLVIHGYNNSFIEAIQAAARIAGGADYKGRVYMFSWPSVSSFGALSAGRRQRRGGGGIVAGVPRRHPARQQHPHARHRRSQHGLTAADARDGIDPRHPRRAAAGGRLVAPRAGRLRGAGRLGRRVQHQDPHLGEACPARDDLHVRRRLGAVAIIVPARPLMTAPAATRRGATRCTSTHPMSTSSTRRRPSTTTGNSSSTRTPTTSTTR